MTYPTSPADLEAERKLLAKVRDLIRLAASPNENEARTAAAKACGPIREHALLVSPAHAENVLLEHQQGIERLVQLVTVCKQRKACP